MVRGIIVGMLVSAGALILAGAAFRFVIPASEFLYVPLRDLDPLWIWLVPLSFVTLLAGAFLHDRQ